MRVCTGSMSGRALVQTVDFFTPVVDDPVAYGRIAGGERAVGHLRDGRPAADGARDRRLSRRTRTARCCRQIFRGGLQALREAGVALLGGHTVQDQEIKFGYAITGEVDPARDAGRTPARGRAIGCS